MIVFKYGSGASHQGQTAERYTMNIEDDDINEM